MACADTGVTMLFQLQRQRLVAALDNAAIG
jgi:hypothetical protein